MKKRKKPIFLAAIVILLLVSVMAFNASAFSAATQTPSANAGQLTPEQQAEKAKLDQDKKKLAEDDAARTKKIAGSKPASGVMVVDKSDDDMPVKGHGVEAISKDQPKIMAPAYTPPKKVDPQDASVNSQSQWYSKESGAG